MNVWTERFRLRYDGTVREKAGSIDELFAGGNSPLYYLLEENGTAIIAVYIPKFSEHEIVIYLMPKGQNASRKAEKQLRLKSVELKKNTLQNLNFVINELLPDFL